MVDTNPHAHRFRTAAQHYLRGRLEYAPMLIDDVAVFIGLERVHRVMDLGCGPGQLALAFAPKAAEVVALDPEPVMLGIARERAAAAGIPIRFIQGGSNDLTEALGRFHLVTIGRAFHWMDQKATLAMLDRLLDASGAVALFGDRHVDAEENAWREPYQALLRQYGADDTTHPKRTVKKGAYTHEATMLASPFQRLERIAVIERRHTPVETFVDRAFSQSSTAPDRLGPDRAASLAGDVSALMQAHARDGQIVELIETHALIARRL